MKSELEKRLNSLSSEIGSAEQRLDLDRKSEELADLESQMANPEIWNNPTSAQTLAKKLSDMKNQIAPWRVLAAQTGDLSELLALSDDDLLKEFDDQITALETEFNRLKQQLLFTEKYDSGDAILRLSSGAGGDDAQEFTDMLERM